jgi:hypothetical protein
VARCRLGRFSRAAKQDQLGAGNVVKIERAQNAGLCAVQAVRRWLDRVEEPDMGHSRAASPASRLTAPCNRAISRVGQRLTACLAIRSDYSFHSLRAAGRFS